MKKIVSKISVLVVVLFVALLFSGSKVALADENTDEILKAATSISISPVSKILQLEANTIYEDSFKVTNNGDTDMEFEVYASPYSYTYSESDDEYKLGFSQENKYTQITRWVTFKGPDGQYSKNPKFVAKPGSSVEVEYRFSTPESIPAGGQYAVLFAHTLSGATTSGGIKTEASPGLVVYGRANGDTKTEATITSINLSQTLKEGEETKNIINASSKVKNTGNVDFTAVGKLTVQGIFGRTYYETPSNEARVSVIPDTELAVSDTWKDTPYFGLFKATWTVAAAGETETISQMILIMPAPIIIIAILLLTIIIVWIIIMVRKRKERRSRFAI